MIECSMILMFLVGGVIGLLVAELKIHRHVYCFIYNNLFWRLERRKDRLLAWWYGWDRSHGLDPRNNLPCQQCGEVKWTEVNAVWSRADPKGYKVRMCKECSMFYAA